MLLHRTPMFKQLSLRQESFLPDSPAGTGRQCPAPESPLLQLHRSRPLSISLGLGYRALPSCCLAGIQHLCFWTGVVSSVRSLEVGWGVKGNWVWTHTVSVSVWSGTPHQKEANSSVPWLLEREDSLLTNWAKL